jgi:hypothetical protein
VAQDFGCIECSHTQTDVADISISGKILVSKNNAHGDGGTPDGDQTLVRRVQNPTAGVAPPRTFSFN